MLYEVITVGGLPGIEARKEKGREVREYAENALTAEAHRGARRMFSNFFGIPLVRTDAHPKRNIRKNPLCASPRLCGKIFSAAS